MPKPSGPIKIKPRKCKYCKLLFTPPCKNEQQRTNAEGRMFCCDTHRTSYHRSGGINFEQLAEKVKKAITKDPQFRDWLAAELNRVSNQLLQDRLREIQSERSYGTPANATV